MWISLSLSLSADDVFSETNDPSWMARLSLPLAADYHDNVFVPNGPPSPESELLPRDGLDSSSFSTFGKTQRTLFVVVLTQAEKSLLIFEKKNQSN